MALLRSKYSVKCVGTWVQLGTIGHEVEVNENDSSCYKGLEA